MMLMSRYSPTLESAPLMRTGYSSKFATFAARNTSQKRFEKTGWGMKQVGQVVPFSCLTMDLAV